MHSRLIPVLLLACLPLLDACVGTTGGDLFSFEAAAAGPEDAAPGKALSFSTGRGYAVELTRARVHVGALYLNKALPVSGAQATSCVLPGIYVAQLTRGLTVDTLSPELQPFPEPGEALSERALAGEVWLTGGDVNAPDDSTVILDVAGRELRGQRRGGHVDLQELVAAIARPPVARHVEPTGDREGALHNACTRNDVDRT